MNLKNMKYLLNVLETENISRSSRELYITQPALSRLIAETETELGYPLFERIGKRIVRNENGTVFMKYADKILGAYEDMQKEVNEKNRKKQMELSVGAEACSQMFPSILRLFQKEEPEANIRIVSSCPLDFGMQGFDFLIKAGSVGKIRSGRVLLTERILLALPPDHPLTGKDRIAYEDTLEYPYVLPASKSSLGRVIEEYFETEGRKRPVGSTIVNNSFLQCGFVAEGLGISLIPEKTWSHANGNKRIVLRQMEGMELKREICLLRNPGRYRTALSLSFERFLIRYFDRKN